MPVVAETAADDEHEDFDAGRGHLPVVQVHLVRMGLAVAGGQGPPVGDQYPPAGDLLESLLCGAAVWHCRGSVAFRYPVGL